MGDEADTHPWIKRIQFVRVSVEIDIGGRRFGVSTVMSANKNAVARLKDGMIVISLPSSWPKEEKERVWKSLLARAQKAIRKGRWRPESSRKVGFAHGQRIIALGNEFEIHFSPSHRFRSRTLGRRIEVGVVEDHPERDARASKLVRRELGKSLMPQVSARIDALNREHFGARLGQVSLRDNTSRWGSCSHDGSISLNLRLLFMPGEILDYVIVHELAHTRYRSHGKKFWTLVERVVPDHREKRKWLRENGWRYPCSDPQHPVSSHETPDEREGIAMGQQTLDEPVSDEPY